MDYEEDHQALITQFFNGLNNSGIEYVIPRGYQNLPKSVPGGDIDIFVAADEFNTAITLAERYEFRPERQSGPLGAIIKKINENPVQNLQKGFREPKRVVRYIKREFNIRGTSDELASYSQWKAHHDEIMIHLMNHIAYKSPMNGNMVRVDPTVETLMFENRRLVNGFWVPYQPDELAHLICRGIFKYEGDFTPYYLEWCESLTDEVLASPEMSAHFDRLLSLLFFKAKSVVRNKVERKEFDMIWKELLSFAGY